MKEMNFREIECGNRFLRSGVIPDKVWKNGCAEYMSSASIIYSKFNRIQSI